MCDALSVVVATFLALIARFDFSVAEIPEQVYINTAKDFLPYSIVITLVLFWLFHLYQSLWEYAGAPEMFMRAHSASQMPAPFPEVPEF